MPGSARCSSAICLFITIFTLQYIYDSGVFLIFCPHCACLPQLAEKKAKIVLTVRNAKDTAVSFYKHATNTFEYTGSFNAFFKLYMDGQGRLIFHSILIGKKMTKIRLLFSSYVSVFSRICQFLDYPHIPSFACPPNPSWTFHI